MTAGAALRSLAGRSDPLDVQRLRGVVGDVVGAVGGAVAASQFPIPSSEDLDDICSGIFVRTEGWESRCAAGEKHAVPGAKTAPHGELVSILASYLARVAAMNGGALGAAVLWREFVLELRWRWEHLTPLPCLVARVPDVRHCLVQQKVDMLQCCITTQIKRNSERATSRSTDGSRASVASGDGVRAASGDESEGEAYHSASEDSPDLPEALQRGVAAVHVRLRLLSGQALRVPVTQEAGESLPSAPSFFLLLQ
jgi:hypothetical protein